MRLSIFPEVSPLPKSKDEKHQQSKKASQCLVRVVENDEDLLSIITTYAWSPFIFDHNKRLADNFLSTDLLVYDIDEGLTIDQCSAIVEREKLCCLCLPSPSHSDSAPRFRVVLPLARTITSPEVYAETWLRGAELFGVVDEQCKDLARFFFSCTKSDGFWLEGELFQPVLPVEKPVDYTTGEFSQSLISVTDDINELVTQIYGEKRERIPEAVDFFIKNAHTGLSGSWVNRLNSFVFSLTLSGVDGTIVHEVCEKLAPDKLDSKDLYQIKRAIKDGERERGR